MINSKTNEQPLPKIEVEPQSGPSKMAMTPHTVPSHDKIRERAYERYEGRGREPGQDEQDWLRAEREICS